MRSLVHKGKVIFPSLLPLATGEQLAAAHTKDAPCKALGVSCLQGHPSSVLGPLSSPGSTGTTASEGIRVTESSCLLPEAVKPICVVNMVGMFISHNRRKRKIFPCVVSSDLGFG